MGHTRVIRHRQDAHMDPAQMGPTEETYSASLSYCIDLIKHKNNIY